MARKRVNSDRLLKSSLAKVVRVEINPSYITVEFDRGRDECRTIIPTENVAMIFSLVYNYADQLEAADISGLLRWANEFETKFIERLRLISATLPEDKRLAVENGLDALSPRSEPSKTVSPWRRQKSID